MKRIFLDSNGRLRNGWWILIFIALMLASRFVYTPVSQALQHLGISKDWLEPLRFGFLLLVTWICLRLRKERLANVGFKLDRRWGQPVRRRLRDWSGYCPAGGGADLGCRWRKARTGSGSQLEHAGLWLVSVHLRRPVRGNLVPRFHIPAPGRRCGCLDRADHARAFVRHQPLGQPRHARRHLVWATIELFIGAVLLALPTCAPAASPCRLASTWAGTGHKAICSVSVSAASNTPAGSSPCFRTAPSG